MSENEKLVERLREGADWPEVRPISASELREAATALTLAQARIRELETALEPFADFEETLRSWHSGKYNPPFSMEQDEWPRHRAVLVRTRPVAEERSIVRKLHREDFEAARKALKEASE